MIKYKYGQKFDGSDGDDGKWQHDKFHELYGRHRHRRHKRR